MTKIIFNMIRHFFIDSVATIVKDSFENTSLNPIMEINYGNGITRGILRFDEKQIIDLAHTLRTVASMQVVTNNTIDLNALQQGR